MAQIDINVEEILKNMMSLEGSYSFVIFNLDGIPLKRSEKTITADKAIHISASVSDLWNVSKKFIQRELRSSGDNDIEVIRIRTKASQEYIITQFGEYTIVAVQLCGKAIEEAKKAAADAAKAELEAQNAKNKKDET